MSNIFPIDFEEKLTMAQDDYILFSDSEDGNKIKKAQYKNLKGEPGTPGTPGTPGKDGKDGTDGAAATITVGSTTTGTPGSSASVTNSGTSSAAVLDFTIPQGAKGEPGEDGQDGADGAAATITVGTTTTLPAGSSATVTNSGTSSAAVLNFGIPQGEQGTGSGDVSGPASSTDGDVALFDGATGKLIKDSGVSLADYQEKLTAGTNIQISNNVISATGGSDIEYVTQAEYNALLPGAESDGKHYFIYTESGGGWQPGANTVLYIPFSGNYNDQMGNTMTLVQGSGPTYSTTTAGEQYGIMPKDNSRITTSLTNLDINSWTVSVRLNWQEYYTYSSAAVVWGFGVGANNKGTGLLFGSEGSREMIIFVWGGDIHTGQYMPQSTWTHICMTQGSGTTTIYMNGQSIYTTSHTYTKNNDVFGIINNPVGYLDEYVGGIDEFIVEDVPRAAQDVADYFNNTKANYGIS